MTLDLQHDADVGTRMVPLSRRLPALLPSLAAALLVTGQALTPKGLDKPITSASRALSELHIATAHTDLLYASNMLVVFGLGALGAACAAIALLARHRDAPIAVVLAVAGAVGGFCGALVNVLIGYNLAAATTAPSSSTVSVLVASNTSTTAHVLIGGYLAGGLLAILLAAVVLWRSPDMGRWPTVLFTGGLILAALSPPGIIAVPLSLPFLIGSGILTIRIRNVTAWELSTEQP